MLMDDDNDELISHYRFEINYWIQKIKFRYIHDAVAFVVPLRSKSSGVLRSTNLQKREGFLSFFLNYAFILLREKAHSGRF